MPTVGWREFAGLLVLKAAVTVAAILVLAVA